MMFNDTQLREVFHFCFLERLLKISDPGIYALKGGVNLRFYFHSPRYSEDMDIDVFAGSVATLKKNGYKILQDAAFKRTLRMYDIADIELNATDKAKHTPTTQRFKLSLITPAGHRLPTKVEFSRRSKDENSSISELIDPDIARQYRKLAFRCRHYSGEMAVVQKIEALMGRVVTQTRDVFDLAILHAGGYASADNVNKIFSLEQKQNAINCLMSLSYEDYVGQVVEFLDVEYREQYKTAAAWNQLQDIVFELLSHDA